MTFSRREALLAAALVAGGCSNPGTPASSTGAASARPAGSVAAPPSAAIAPSPAAAPAACATPTLAPQARAAALAVLATSRDRDELDRAAVELASSGEAEAIHALGELLRRADFLARLDDLKSPQERTYHLRRVMLALEGHPTPETGALCVRLAGDPAFLADPDRKIFALSALATVRPMSEEAVQVFRQANTEGYFSAVLPLVVLNGGPRALALFEEMVRDTGQSAESRVADIHAAVLPRRTDPEVLRTVDRLLSSTDIGDEIAVGLVETVFDHQSRRWFGPARNPPAPPPWDAAPREALALALALAGKARARKDLAVPLHEAVDRTSAAVRAALARR